ncbi:MAG: hypothetical protein GQF41_0741 [Candidatus Rifleibacterium amylolyticum]|nr:MAG: hypothetical protein GQF41_0741 [Candidatus Rifleibacterium amylolyticum]
MLKNLNDKSVLVCTTTITTKISGCSLHFRIPDLVTIAMFRALQQLLNPDAESVRQNYKKTSAGS